MRPEIHNTIARTLGASMLAELRRALRITPGVAVVSDGDTALRPRREGESSTRQPHCAVFSFESVRDFRESHPYARAASMTAPEGYVPLVVFVEGVGMVYWLRSDGDIEIARA